MYIYVYVHKLLPYNNMTWLTFVTPSAPKTTCLHPVFSRRLYGDGIFFANVDFFRIDSVDTSEQIFMKL